MSKTINKIARMISEDTSDFTKQTGPNETFNFKKIAQKHLKPVKKIYGPCILQLCGKGFEDFYISKPSDKVFSIKDVFGRKYTSLRTLSKELLKLSDNLLDLPLANNTSLSIDSIIKSAKESISSFLSEITDNDLPKHLTLESNDISDSPDHLRIVSVREKSLPIVIMASLNVMTDGTDVGYHVERPSNNDNYKRKIHYFFKLDSNKRLLSVLNMFKDA